MFDRALAQRPPTAWQADPTLFEGATGSDFAAWRIAPLQGELSALSREALARFDAEQAAAAEPDAAAATVAPAPPFKPGLPAVVTHFVPDVHVPVGQTLRPDPPAPTVPEPARDTLAAPEAQALTTEATSPAETTEAPHPTDPQAPEGGDGLALADAPAPEAEADWAEPEPALDGEVERVVAQDAAAEATEADLAGEDVIAAEALAEVERERAESLASQAQPTGIDPDEVARREAEQYQLGRAEGERAAREALEQEVQAQRTVLAAVAQDLHALLQHPREFFEPLKRLAMHVAEQITLTQWQSSTQTLEALIRRCLDTLDHANQGAVVVELHPLDLGRLQQAAPESIRGMRLEANDALRMGSVRLYANDAMVEDLIEHRLSAIVRGLHIDEQAWQQRSLLLREPADADHADPSSEDDDVHP